MLNSNNNSLNFYHFFPFALLLFDSKAFLPESIFFTASTDTISYTATPAYIKMYIDKITKYNIIKGILY